MGFGNVFFSYKVRVQEEEFIFSTYVDIILTMLSYYESSQLLFYS